MLARLGNVLYWAGCAAAAFLVGMALVRLVFDQSVATRVAWKQLGFSIAIAVVVWLASRAAKYVFAGK